VARQVKKRHHAWVSCSMGPSDHLLCWGCGPPFCRDDKANGQVPKSVILRRGVRVWFSAAALS
jgi:hypothetical protein